MPVEWHVQLYIIFCTFHLTNNKLYKLPQLLNHRSQSFTERTRKLFQAISLQHLWYLVSLTIWTYDMLRMFLFIIDLVSFYQQRSNWMHGQCRALKPFTW